METQTQVTTLRRMPNCLVYPGTIAPPKKTVTLQSVVCKAFKIPEEVLFMKTRKREIVNARQVYIYLIIKTVYTEEMNINGMTQKIRLPMNNRDIPVCVARHVDMDHASMYHSVKTVEQYMDTERFYRETIRDITKGLLNYDIVMPRIPGPRKNTRNSKFTEYANN
jgi:hypothetical protein